MAECQDEDSPSKSSNPQNEVLKNHITQNLSERTNREERSICSAEPFRQAFHGSCLQINPVWIPKWLLGAELSLHIIPSEEHQQELRSLFDYVHKLV